MRHIIIDGKTREGKVMRGYNVNGNIYHGEERRRSLRLFISKRELEKKRGGEKARHISVIFFLPFFSTVVLGRPHFLLLSRGFTPKAVAGNIVASIPPRFHIMKEQVLQGVCFSLYPN